MSVHGSEEESEEPSEDDDAPNQAESSHGVTVKDEPLDDEQLERLLLGETPSETASGTMDEGYDRQVSPPAPRSRPLSRSPPKSRSPSPDSLEKMMAALDLSARRKRVVSSEPRRAHKSRRNRSTNWAGARGGGRKGKKDASNVKVDSSGIWG
jgi:RIO kinase 2